MSTKLPSTENSSPTADTTVSLAGVVPQNPQESFLPSSMYQARRRTPSEVSAAQTLATQVRKDASALSLELEILSDGAFATGNTAVLSCHRHLPQGFGFDYKFQVSGATMFWQSQPDKDTPSDHVLLFATGMIDILRNNEKEIMKAASYTAETLGKPLKKGEKSPHARKAARSIVTLLQNYYEAATSKSTEQAGKWKLRATENATGSHETEPTQTNHAPGDPSAPSLMSPVVLHTPLIRREFDAFHSRYQTLVGTPFSTFPVRWSGPTTTPIELVIVDRHAAARNMHREAKRKALGREQDAGTAGRGTTGGSSNESRVQGPVTQDRSAECGSQEDNPVKRSKRVLRDPSLAEQSTAQAQRHVFTPPASSPAFGAAHGQFWDPPDQYISHPDIPHDPDRNPWVPLTRHRSTINQNTYQESSAPWTEVSASLCGSARADLPVQQMADEADFPDLSNVPLDPLGQETLDSITALLPRHAYTGPRTVSQREEAGYGLSASHPLTIPTAWDRTEYRSADESQENQIWPQQWR